MRTTASDLVLALVAAFFLTLLVGWSFDLRHRMAYDPSAPARNDQPTAPLTMTTTTDDEASR